MYIHTVLYYSALQPSFHPLPHHINQFSTFPNGVFAITLNTSKSTCSQRPSGHTRHSNWLGNTHISGGHGRQLRVGIVRRGNLDNIGRNDMQAVQASQDGAQLAGRPPASLGSASRGRERGVDRIDLHPVKIEIERAERSPHRRRSEID